MPRELITLTIGQCGNQIGTRFWDLALREHASLHETGTPLYDEPLSSFFRNVRTGTSQTLPYTPFESNPIETLKARAILIDMEEGVLSRILSSRLGSLFDPSLLIKDVSGSGNNWAHGHEVYGPKYEGALIDTIRRESEKCDSLQSFVLIHSLGGGTGSGLGAYLLRLLRDDYQDVYRFSVAVFPSEDDDVVTSPYNSVLALNELTEYADCVLPIENSALFGLVERVQKMGRRMAGGRLGSARQRAVVTTGPDEGQTKERDAFAEMNNIAAHLLTNLTSSMRFAGKLNVDLNEISMNLVPFPKLHYIIPSIAPLVVPNDLQALMGPRRLDQMFMDVFDKDFQLMQCDPRHSRYLACGLMVRGNVQVSDLNRNIKRIKQGIDMIHWNRDGFKIGICNTPPVGQQYSLLSLANNCCIAERFRDMEDRFMQLYQRDLYVHHYLRHGMSRAVFDEALEALVSLREAYAELATVEPPETVMRYVPEI